MVRRHRMIERFLTDVLGIPWDEVHEEAERLEHAMSPVLEERMTAAIGDAKTCPHGHPIVEGAREEGVLLADVEEGASVHVLRFENEAEELLHYLMRSGLRPGLEGQVETSDDDVVVIISDGGQPRGLAQRRRDGVGPRRPGADAAGAAARGAGALQRPLRPLAAADRTPGFAADLAQAAIEAVVGCPQPHRAVAPQLLLMLADRRRELDQAPLRGVALACQPGLRPVVSVHKCHRAHLFTSARSRASCPSHVASSMLGAVYQRR